MAVAAVINYCVGNAIGGFDLGVVYFGFSLVLSLIVVLALLPIAGLVLFLIFWDAMTSSMITLMGIVENAWIDALLTITWWLALFAGIIAAIMIVVKLVKMLKDGKFDAKALL